MKLSKFKWKCRTFKIVKTCNCFKKNLMDFIEVCESLNSLNELYCKWGVMIVFWENFVKVYTNVEHFI